MNLPSGIEPASFRFLAQCGVVCCPFEVQRGSAFWRYRVCVLFYTKNTWPNTLPLLVIKIHLWWGAFRKPHLSNACVRTPFNFLSIPLQNRFEIITFLLHLSLMITAFTCAHVLLEFINNCERSFVIGRVAVSQTEPLQIFTYLCIMKNISYREKNY
jgi:hypothetical protein